LKLIATHFANATPVEVSGNSPQQPMAGTPMVDTPTHPTGSATYPLDVLAALSSDGKTFYVSVVNPTEEEQVLSPRIAGVKVQDAGKLWQIAAATVEASNEPGKQPVVEIIEHGAQQLAAPLRIPPISVNLYEFGVV
jgi:alpha-L-arabinofuranosidase